MKKRGKRKITFGLRVWKKNLKMTIKSLRFLEFLKCFLVKNSLLLAINPNLCAATTRPK